jgi:hypothetical protein
MHTCNPSIQKVGAGGSKVQGQPSWGYTARPYLKKRNKKKKENK